ncbi:LOW QUALITY PROTEIN: Ribonuclease H-like domain containing protein [Trema orientale]|uniref:Ribonuclease H-like domain containing protein n=1 Tax=Trema orientale TaxID=63057 RepID=A0A2P5EHR9_TREOI|nr:LOW QUALITY PROTEIN: Ribonuclease H-like domain containing protein [Trema orientale]
MHRGRRARNLTYLPAGGRVSRGLIYHRRLSFFSGGPFTPLFRLLLFSVTEESNVPRAAPGAVRWRRQSHMLCFTVRFPPITGRRVRGLNWCLNIGSFITKNFYSVFLLIYPGIILRSIIEATPSPRSHDRAKWKRSPTGKLKLNVDAAINLRTNCIGVGGVFRDSNGDVVVDVLSKRLSLTQSLYAVELIAMKEALSWCKDKSYVVYMLESDCQNAITVVNSICGLSSEDIIVGDIQFLLLNCRVVSYCYVARESNKVALTLAQSSVKEASVNFSLDDILDCIATYVADDVC